LGKAIEDYRERVDPETDLPIKQQQKIRPGKAA
jgi:hypothetical protein